MSGSGISWAICKSASRSRQITTPVPHHSVFYRPDALPAAQPTVPKHWRHRRLFFLIFCYFLFNSSGRLGVSFFYWKALLICALLSSILFACVIKINISLEYQHLICFSYFLVIAHGPHWRYAKMSTLAWPLSIKAFIIEIWSSVLSLQYFVWRCSTVVSMRVVRFVNMLQ